MATSTTSTQSTPLEDNMALDATAPTHTFDLEDKATSRTSTAQAINLENKITLETSTTQAKDLEAKSASDATPAIVADLEDKVTVDAAPVHIIDLLRNAATASSSTGCLYLERGLSEDATRETYAELYRKAQVCEAPGCQSQQALKANRVIRKMLSACWKRALLARESMSLRTLMIKDRTCCGFGQW